MNQPTVIGAACSDYVRTVRLVLTEKNVPCHLVDIERQGHRIEHSHKSM